MKNNLGTQPINKLLRNFAIPSIIAMLVSALYNIVDQFFIGRSVGELGNAATNITFPLTTSCIALALLLGIGAASAFNLTLGEGKKEKALYYIGNSALLLFLSGIVLCIIIQIFLEPMLRFFGSPDNVLVYAKNYTRVTAIGFPFLIFSTGGGHLIRADGSPKYSMTSMLAGAILNTILDPIFIFVFKMGVEGAAIATVISQIVTFALNIIYLKKFKSIKISRESLKLKMSVVKNVAMLGISSFITQMSVVFVMAAENNLLGKYGMESKFGSEIPITVLGIVMKISQILNSIIIGIAAGAQPIFGYNYGAGKFDRVKKTLKIVLGSSVIISTFAFILFQTIPDKLIAIFGSGDENYIEFACLTFRTYLMLCICNGIQIPSGIFFQAIGKSIKSAILSISRQIAFLIPAMIIFSHFFGLKGVLFAGPFADGLAFVLASIFLVKEIKNLKSGNVKVKEIKKNNGVETKVDKHVIITVSREYASGGRYVGKLVAEKLGIKIYDKEFIIKVAEETGLSQEYIESNEQKRDALAALNSGYYAGINNSDELFIKESEMIRDVAQKESAVIVGRCADSILQDRDDVVRVFIYSDMKNKIKRATTYYHLEQKNAEKEIKRIDKLRANHYKYYTGKDWNNHSNYDICINSDVLGVEKTADLICDIVKEKVNV